MSQNKENTSVTIGSYLVSKEKNKLNEHTKYIKLGYGPNASKAQKNLVDAIIQAAGTDVLYINMFSQKFREEKNIPEFKRASISVALDEAKETKPTKQQPSSKAKAQDEDEF